MRTLLAGLCALALGLGVTVPAQAQHFNINKIINSGNGAYNTIAVHNGGHHGAPGFYPGAGYGPVGYAPVPMGVPGYGGGYNRNIIANSGNGQGNTIAIQNGGGYSYGMPGGCYGGVTVGGVNINVITNSGNGIGNTIAVGNR